MVAGHRLGSFNLQIEFSPTNLLEGKRRIAKLPTHFDRGSAGYFLKRGKTDALVLPNYNAVQREKCLPGKRGGGGGRAARRKCLFLHGLLALVLNLFFKTQFYTSV